MVFTLVGFHLPCLGKFDSIMHYSSLLLPFLFSWLLSSFLLLEFLLGCLLLLLLKLVLPLLLEFTAATKSLQHLYCSAWAKAEH